MERSEKKVSINKMKSDNRKSIEAMENNGYGSLITEQEKGGSGKKKTKYISLYSADANDIDVVLLPGRHKCDCQALKHKLINNCSSCGRIVCEQEGSGPCSFCGNLVYTKEERNILNRGTKKSETLHNILKNAKRIESDAEDSLRKATDHKNKLLEYDQTSKQRTKVYDDQSDYFQTNSKWLHPAKKEKLQKMEELFCEKKYDRNNKHIKIDLLGRKMNVETNPSENMLDVDLTGVLNSESSNYTFDIESSLSQLCLERPIFIETESARKGNGISTIHMSINRIQDKEIKEMCDDGMCLSMHQPWASLLVRGIKKHEGRVWYSSHRGRLWIASAARSPIEEEISSVETMYQSIYKNINISFPRNYPAGCLLGCVQVDDVLPQEEYQTLFPTGESESPYVFVCSNAIELPMKFPMKGEHKIYQINSQVHKAAKSALKGIMD